MYTDRCGSQVDNNIYNVSTTLGGSCENVGKIKLLQHIPGKVLKSCHDVAAKSCKKTSPQHYGNINSFRQSVVATFLQYGKICVNNIRTCFRKKIDGVKSGAHNISLADFMFHFRKTNAANEM